MTFKVSIATEKQHDAIVAVARTTKYTSAYGNIMFSSPEHYKRGWIYAAELDGKVVGFACVRHLVRRPETNIYFVGVREDLRSKGCGARLLREIAHRSPHSRIVLKVATDNPRARSFYERIGFTLEGFDADYWHLAVTREMLLCNTE